VKESTARNIHIHRSLALRVLQDRFLGTADARRSYVSLAVNLSHEGTKTLHALQQERPCAGKAIMMIVTIVSNREPPHSFFQSVVLVEPAVVGTRNHSYFHADDN
jgi:hypothetical protein